MKRNYLKVLGKFFKYKGQEIADFFRDNIKDFVVAIATVGILVGAFLVMSLLSIPIGAGFSFVFPQWFSDILKIREYQYFWAYFEFGIQLILWFIVVGIGLLLVGTLLYLLVDWIAENWKRAVRDVDYEQKKKEVEKRVKAEEEYAQKVPPIIPQPKPVVERDGRKKPDVLRKTPAKKKKTRGKK